MVEEKKSEEVQNSEENKEDDGDKKEKRDLGKMELDRVMNISEKYLEKVNRMKMLAGKDLRENIEKVEELKEKLREFEGEISAARKTGKNMFHSSSFLKLAKGKIGILEIEYNEEEIDKMIELINEIGEQIKEDKDRKVFDLRSEIMMKAKDNISKESKEESQEKTDE
ncbi:MAG: hypothetical protein PWQ87_141 [Candidatus Woesearchaeota archaeon]|nr:hypothetical protein [Candidatus Woesearchaeota archaeon]